jgi:hypothetical protein
MHVAERHRAARRLGKRLRIGRRADRRLGCGELEQALRRSGRQLNLAPHFRKRTERGSGKRRIDDELAQRAAGQPTGQDALRAEPDNADHRAGRDEDDGAGQQGARERAAAGGAKGALGGIGKLLTETRLLAGGLHRLNVGERFLGQRGRAGKRVLGLARQPPDLATEQHQRQHNERDGEEHEAGQPEAGHQHHGDGADQHQRIAQRDRCRGAEHRLDLQRVGGEARHHLAGHGGVVEAGAERQQMGEDLVAQIGDGALAEPAYEIETGGARHRQHGDDQEHDGEILIDKAGMGVGEAVIDDAPDRHRDDQGRRRCHNQRQQRQRQLPTVAEH